MATLPEGKLFRVPGTEPVYLISGGQKHWIVSWIILDEMIALGLPAPVYDATQEELDAVPTGIDITLASQGMDLYYAATPPVTPPVTGIMDWLKKNWMWVAVGGIGVGLIIALVKPRRKK